MKTHTYSLPDILTFNCGLDSAQKVVFWKGQEEVTAFDFEPTNQNKAYYNISDTFLNQRIMMQLSITLKFLFLHLNLLSNLTAHKNFNIISKAAD